MNRTSIAILAGIAALSVGGCVNREAQKEAAATQKILSDTVQAVKTIPVATSRIEDKLEITGQLTATDDSQIGPKAPGRLASVLVRDGDAVSAGQLLATQETSTLNDQLRQAMAGVASARSQLAQAISNAQVGPSKSTSAIAAAEANLRSAQAVLAKAKNGARPEERSQADWAVKSAKSALDNAKAELDRQTMLFGEGAGTKQQFDLAKTQYDVANTQYNTAVQGQLILANGTRKEDIDQATAGVQAAREQLKQAKDQKQLDVLYSEQVQTARAGVQSAEAQVTIARQAITDTEIRAPFAGRVAGKPAQIGTVLGAGTPVLRLVGHSGTYFEGEVPESDVNKVRIGNDVDVHVDAMSGTLKGHVAAVSPVGNDVGRLFKLRIAIDSTDPGVLPGMFARGTIIVSAIPDAIVVPVSAVSKLNGKDVVFLADGTKAKAVPVQLGIQNQDRIQVTGLKVGDNLVVQGQAGLVDGAVIRVQTQTNAARTGKEG